MKKIMFNDKYGLTNAVIEGRKTMARRIVSQSTLDYYLYEAEDPTIIDAAKYDIGDVVAVAQAYGEIYVEYRENGLGIEACNMAVNYQGHPGWNNKMFVCADLMPHRIRITDIKVERLQDICDEDCLKEGIKPIKSENVPQINETGVIYYTFKGVTGIWTTPRKAFAALIDKVSGKGTWERNPWVFVYEFELVEE